MTWAQLLERFDLIENDLQDRGVDIGDPDLMQRRSWRWLRTRIEGCLSDPDCRTHRHFAPQEQETR